MTVWRYGSDANGVPVWHTYGKPDYYPGGPVVVNLPPVPRFDITQNQGLSLTIDASTSSDPDGLIAGYVVNFGDGTPNITQSTPVFNHTYSVGGKYTILLSVIDDDGASTASSQQITVTATVVNNPPIAAFTATPDNTVSLRANFDSSLSSDPDGTITKHHWDFGDGTVADTASAVAASHTYSAAGTFIVKLVVTDNLGAVSSTVSHTVTVAPLAPVASFTESDTPGSLVAAFDASASHAGAGDTVTNYAWDYGNGVTRTGATVITPTYTYPAEGTYTVSLTITTAGGASATSVKTISVTSSTLSGTAYTNDDGNGGTNAAPGNGQQRTGTSYTLFNTSGSDVGTQANAAGAGKLLSLPVGTQQKLKAWTSTNQYGAQVTAGGGIIGAGSRKSILSQIPSTSSGTTISTLMRVNGAGPYTFQDFQLLGTSQSVVLHQGLFINAKNTRVERVVLKGAGIGNDKAPPGETFGLSFYHGSAGTATGPMNFVVNDVEIDGAGHGGTGFGTNGSGASSAEDRAIGDYTVNRLWSHGNLYSACIALWQQKGTAIFNDCVFDDSRCFWNIERCEGLVKIVRPRIGTLHVAADAGYGATHIFAEAGTGWTTQATAQAFRFEIWDPRNLDGSPYTGPRIGMTLGSATGGTNFYTKANTFKCYSATGADISSSFYA